MSTSSPRAWKTFLIVTIALLLLCSISFIFRSNFQSLMNSSSEEQQQQNFENISIASPVQTNKDCDLKDLQLRTQTIDMGKFFRDTRQQFLTPETIHSPFSPQKPIEDLSGIPIAYGDFDADKYTDIYLLTDNGYTIRLLKGYSCVDGKTILTLFGSRRCLSHMKNFTCHFKRPIYNLVASDFTGRTRQDLLITIQSQDKYHFDIILVPGIDWNDEEEFRCQLQKILVQESLSEPFILDYNGDMITDFIIQTDHCPLQLILGGPLEETPETICLTNLTTITDLSRPHASGFFNLNLYSEDLTPDLFINGPDEFEYIFNIPGVGFIERKKYSFPENLVRGQSAFADINYDGKIDHLIPVCLDGGLFENCTEPGLMIFDQVTQEWSNVLFTNETDLGSNFNRSFTFVEQKIYGHTIMPVTLHIGDLNYDGYPDFAMVLQDTETKQTVGGIFLNKIATPSSSNDFGRVFELDSLVEYDDGMVHMLNLFDIYNDGRLNLLLTTKNESTGQFMLRAYDYYREKSIYYSFLRINIISGLCSDKSSVKPCPKHLAFGSTPPGVSVCFQGPSGNEHSCSFQMGQSAHFAMQPPYIIFGLGDTLNVINDMSVSLANGNNSQRSKEWNEIIPGSKLVIVPFGDNIKDWDLRVFINMSIYSLVALSFLLVLGLILVLAISVLHFFEKREDRADNEQYRKAWL